MKYRIIRNALSETKGRLKQGFKLKKTEFQTTFNEAPCHFQHRWRGCYVVCWTTGF